MSKTILYYGSEIENTPVFNSNLNIDLWEKCLTSMKMDGFHVSSVDKVYYYKLNDIDIIEKNVNNRKMYNQSNFKMHRINNTFLKIEYTENPLDFILSEFDYFNKQIHKLQIFNIDKIGVYFDEYSEDGNIYYNIYSIINNESNIVRFIDIINKYVSNI